MRAATTTMGSTARQLLARVRVVRGTTLIVAPVLMLAMTSARATDWPAKPVTVVVGYAAGGNTDVMARMASKKLSEDLKQSFIVENRIGAGHFLPPTLLRPRPTATRCSSPPLRRSPSCRSCRR